MGIAPYGIYKRIVNTHFIGAQLIDEKKNADFGYEFSPSDVISFSPNGGNYLTFLEYLIGFFNSVPRKYELFAQAIDGRDFVVDL
tara:strand:+ start:496 stop:750 length:255 start_codon:yes stop_codon:yes gene_type:complete